MLVDSHGAGVEVNLLGMNNAMQYVLVMALCSSNDMYLYNSLSYQLIDVFCLGAAITVMFFVFSIPFNASSQTMTL